MYDLATVDLHKLNVILVHADQHVPRVLANGDARELDIIDLPLIDLLVACEVEDNNGAVRNDNEPLTVWRNGEVVCAKLCAVFAKVVHAIPCEIPDSASKLIILRADDDMLAVEAPCGCRAGICEFTEILYTCASLPKLVWLSQLEASTCLDVPYSSSVFRLRTTCYNPLVVRTPGEMCYARFVVLVKLVYDIVCRGLVYNDRRVLARRRKH